MHWSEWSTSISHVIFPQHNRHQSQLQYTQDTCEALSSPRNSPSINYLRDFPLSNLSSSFHSNHSLHHATTLYSIPLVPKPPFSSSLLLPVFLSLPSNCIPHAIQATPLFSNANHCLSQSCCMPFYNPHFPPLYVGVALHILLHDRLLFYSLFEDPFLVTYLHPLLSHHGIFSLQLNVHFVIHS